MKDQEAWLRAIFEHAPMEIVLKDTEGRIMAISGTAAHKLGIDPTDFIGRTTADLLPAEIADVYMTADRAVVETGEPSQQEVIEEINGSLRCSLSSKFPVRNDDGVITGVCSVTNDITELRDSERALREAHDSLEQQIDERTRELLAREQDLVDAQKIGHIGSYVFDHVANRLVSFSEEYAHIHGLSVDEIAASDGLNVDHLTHPDDWDRVEAAYNRSWKNQEPFEVAYRIIRPDGAVRHILEIGDLVGDVEGSPNWLKGIVQDITDRSVLERAKTEFVSTVSHELRTPLTSIKGALGLLRSGITGDLTDDFQSLLDIAYNNSDRLVLLINDILDVEKIEAGKMDYTMRPVDMAELVAETTRANAGYGDAHNVMFVCEPTDGHLVVDGDKDRLIQVVSNLMSNAAKFSPDGETVRLSATREGDTACIAVSDNGPGIPEDFRNIIFEKFTQADSSDTRSTGGTGLGLSIARAIVEHHGGTIRFDSEVGVGSTFYITLPLLE